MSTASLSANATTSLYLYRSAVKKNLLTELSGCLPTGAANISTLQPSLSNLNLAFVDAA